MGLTTVQRYCAACDYPRGASYARVLAVVVCLSQVGYNDSSNRMTYHPQKGRGYGYATALKFCRLP